MEQVSLMFYGGCLVSFLVYQGDRFINSACHRWGYRTFNSHDNSINNHWAIICLGENFHNNHHAFPSSAKHGFFQWHEIDFNYLMLSLYQELGLVEGLRFPDLKQIEKNPVLETGNSSQAKHA